MSKLIPSIFLTLTTIVFAVRAPTEPLAERVRNADTVFLGTVTNKVVNGDWARADILVEKPLWNAKAGDKTAVIWRTQINGRPIYDTPEGTRGIAILGDKHEGRYWLRDDKFEAPNQLDEVTRLVKETKTPPAK